MSVPSSISSSNDRLPPTHAVRRWSLGLCCFVLILCCIEVGARKSGYGPVLKDTKELWSEHRARIPEAGENSIVLLGASRMQLDLVPEVLSSYYPDEEVVMLAVDGSPPMAMLESLSNDVEFTGTVICSLFITALLPRSWDAQKSHVEFYENEWSARPGLSQGIGSYVAQHLALHNDGLSYARLLGWLSGVNYYNYLKLTYSRHKQANYTIMGEYLAEHARIRYERTKESYEEAPNPPLKEMDDQYLRVELAVGKMMRRGCRVVFVRLPTSGKIWDLDQRHWPRRLYWDRFAQQTIAETYHFEDYLSLSGFECPDGSHLDYADAIRFTHAFAALLLEDSDKYRDE